VNIVGSIHVEKFHPFPPESISSYSRFLGVNELMSAAQTCMKDVPYAAASRPNPAEVDIELRLHVCISALSVQSSVLLTALTKVVILSCHAIQPWGPRSYCRSVSLSRELKEGTVLIGQRALS